MRSLVLLILAVLALPTASACGGLSPGDQLNADGARCTLAFLVASPDALYFATAGHCIEEGSTASNPELGEFGEAVFSIDEGEAGRDFALIRVDPAVWDKLNPAVCAWGGPSGVYRDTPGGGDVHHYGHGVGFGDGGETTRERTGTNLWTDLDAFTFIGMGVPGDSGSAVVSADGRAIGILTHLGGYVGTQGTNGGTHLDQGFELAAEKGFTNLRLVLDGEDPLDVMAQMRAARNGGGGGGGNEPAAPQPTTPTPSPEGNETTPSPTPQANETTQPDNGTAVVPAAERDDDDGARFRTPGPSPALLALGALAALAVRRRRQ